MRALETNGWNTTATAKALGMPLSTLKFKMTRLEVQEIKRFIRGTARLTARTAIRYRRNPARKSAPGQRGVPCG